MKVIAVAALLGAASSNGTPPNMGVEDSWFEVPRTDNTPPPEQEPSNKRYDELPGDNEIFETKSK